MLSKRAKIILAIVIINFLIVVIYLATRKEAPQIVPPRKSISEKLQECGQKYTLKGILYEEVVSDGKKVIVDRPIEDVVRIVNECGISISVEEFLYVQRVVYFEVAPGKDKRQSAIAVASAILNRHLFSLKDKGFPVKNVLKKYYFHQNKKMSQLKDVAFKYSKRKTRKGKVYVVYQFSCVPDHPSYFYPNALKDKEGKWTIYGFNMDRVRARVTYEALTAVLTGQVDDPTCGALFYKNSELVPNVKWNGKSEAGRYIIRHVHEVNPSCPRKIGKHDFYTLVLRGGC